MARSKTIAFCKITPVPNASWDALNDLIEAPPTNNQKYINFANHEAGSEYIFVTLIHRVSYSLQTFNLSTGQPSKSTIESHKAIDFRFDLKHQILEIYGSGKDAKHVLDAIRPVTQQKAIQGFAKPVSQILPVFDEINEGYEVQNITIENFQYNSSIIGRYTAKVQNSLEAKSLLEKYKSDVSKVQIEFLDNDFSGMKVSIYSSGKITVQSSLFTLGSFLEFYKSEIVGKLIGYA